MHEAHAPLERGVAFWSLPLTLVSMIIAASAHCVLLPLVKLPAGGGGMGCNTGGREVRLRY